MHTARNAHCKMSNFINFFKFRFIPNQRNPLWNTILDRETAFRFQHFSVKCVTIWNGSWVKIRNMPIPTRFYH